MSYVTCLDLNAPAAPPEERGALEELDRAALVRAVRGYEAPAVRCSPADREARAAAAEAVAVVVRDDLTAWVEGELRQGGLRAARRTLGKIAHTLRLAAREADDADRCADASRYDGLADRLDACYVGGFVELVRYEDDDEVKAVSADGAWVPVAGMRPGERLCFYPDGGTECNLGKLCPIHGREDAKRRARKYTKPIVDLLEQYRGTVCTLTIPRVPLSQAQAGYDRLWSAFLELQKDPVWSKPVAGCYAALESTFRPDNDTWNLHLHVLVLHRWGVDFNYGRIRKRWADLTWNGRRLPLRGRRVVRCGLSKDAHGLPGVLCGPARLRVKRVRNVEFEPIRRDEQRGVAVAVAECVKYVSKFATATDRHGVRTLGLEDMPPTVLAEYVDVFCRRRSKPHRAYGVLRKVPKPKRDEEAKRPVRLARWRWEWNRRTRTVDVRAVAVPVDLKPGDNFRGRDGGGVTADRGSP